jgi:hypothetical protein
MNKKEGQIDYDKYYIWEDIDSDGNYTYEKRYRYKIKKLGRNIYSFENTNGLKLKFDITEHRDEISIRERNGEDPNKIFSDFYLKQNTYEKSGANKIRTMKEKQIKSDYKSLKEKFDIIEKSSTGNNMPAEMLEYYGNPFIRVKDEGIKNLNNDTFNKNTHRVS